MLGWFCIIVVTSIIVKKIKKCCEQIPQVVTNVDVDAEVNICVNDDDNDANDANDANNANNANVDTKLESIPKNIYYDDFEWIGDKEVSTMDGIDMIL